MGPGSGRRRPLTGPIAAPAPRPLDVDPQGEALPGARIPLPPPIPPPAPLDIDAIPVEGDAPLPLPPDRIAPPRAARAAAPRPQPTADELNQRELDRIRSGRSIDETYGNRFANGGRVGGTPRWNNSGRPRRK